ncbi:hypothetical protein ACFFJB_09025 [Camelimonas abortus]|uniref:Uncharacterized protein n=1 Tax=Camelimonas abortus TaxID=1017184 RepID=A0ABV7LGP3_9HYPH
MKRQTTDNHNGDAAICWRPRQDPPIFTETVAGVASGQSKPSLNPAAAARGQKRGQEVAELARANNYLCSPHREPDGDAPSL